MSTYYEFRCSGCGKTGGFFSRQMWGWGNADVIANHKFLMQHTAECGKTFEVLSEHDAGWGDNHDDDYKRNEYWPHSDDWSFVASVKDDWREEWVEKFAEDGSVG